MTSRQFPARWTVEQIPDGYKVLDAAGQALAYIYARATNAQADIAKVLTLDEARRIAVSVGNCRKCWRRKLSASQLFLPIHIGASKSALEKWLLIMTVYPTSTGRPKWPMLVFCYCFIR